MKLGMFVIDDGSRHTICAASVGRAFGLYAQYLYDTGGDWPDEWPKWERVPDDKKVTIDLQMNLHSAPTKIDAKCRESLLDKPTLTASEWCELVGEKYMACSEY